MSKSNGDKMTCQFRQTDGFRQSVFCDVTGENVEKFCVCSTNFKDCPNYKKSEVKRGDNNTDIEVIKTAAMGSVRTCSGRNNRLNALR